MLDSARTSLLPDLQVHGSIILQDAAEGTSKGGALRIRGNNREISLAQWWPSDEQLKFQKSGECVQFAHWGGSWKRGGVASSCERGLEEFWGGEVLIAVICGYCALKRTAWVAERPYTGGGIPTVPVVPVQVGCFESSITGSQEWSLKIWLLS
jgi:hypothetical protein